MMFRLMGCLAVLVVLVGVAEVRAEPVVPTVPGFSVEVYATLPRPWELTFDPLGNLYVGQDGVSSGKVYRVSVGGGVATEYGSAALPDPDAVIFDATGVIAGSPNSLLVAGLQNDGVNGHISAILPDESIITVMKKPEVGNTDYMAFDSTGRLLLANYSAKRIRVTSGGTPSTIITLPSNPGGIAVDAADRIFVSSPDGVIRVFNSQGTLLDGSFATIGSSGTSPLAFGEGGPFGSDLYCISDGSLLRIDSVGNTSVLGAGFNNPVSDIAFGPDTALYVSSKHTDQILRIIPEPSTLILLLTGALGLLLHIRRRR